MGMTGGGVGRSVECTRSINTMISEEEEENLEGIVTLSESSDKFEVFNQPHSPEDILADIDSQQQVHIITSDEMGIQRKS